VIKRLVVASALLVAGMSAASAGAGADPASAITPVLLDHPNPELLLEIVPTTPAEKLQDTAVRYANVCQVLDLRDRLPEPKPGDTKSLLNYGNKYFGVLKTFAPNARIDDPRRRGAQIVPPKELADAVAAERAAMYAFHIRVQYTESGFTSKFYDRAELERRLRWASTALAASPFTKAEAQLAAGQQQFCPRTND
jgi:hypothetical protein